MEIEYSQVRLGSFPDLILTTRWKTEVLADGFESSYIEILFMESLVPFDSFL